jgi:hypothetical protein
MSEESNNSEFVKWLKKAKEYALSEYGWRHTLPDEDTFEGYFDKGLSPSDAIEEELNQWAGAYLNQPT